MKVFPDEFHLRTLTPFLTALAQLQPEVKLKDVVVSMMNRLAKFVASAPENMPTGIDMFALFNDHCSALIQNQKTMPLEDAIALQVALLGLVVKCYPNRIDHVDRILAFSGQTIAATGKATYAPSGSH